MLSLSGTASASIAHLGYGSSAGVEVGDRKPSVERDLHIPVQADSRKEQAFHVLKGDGTLLLIVDEKC